MGWALWPVTGIEELPAFEEGIAGPLGGGTASVLCQYDRSRFDPVTLATVAAFHNRQVAAATYHADAVLRICRQYAPAGIRIAGEIDYQAEGPLALALAEAVRLEGDVTVNMAALDFADAPCTAMIADAARHPGAGIRRRVAVRAAVRGRCARRRRGAAAPPGLRRLGRLRVRLAGSRTRRRGGIRR